MREFTILIFKCALLKCRESEIRCYLNLQTYVGFFFSRIQFLPANVLHSHLKPTAGKQGSTANSGYMSVTGSMYGVT